MKKYELTNETILQIISNKDITPNQKLLIIAIIEDTNENNTFNIKRLSNILNINTTTIYKNIRDLNNILIHRKMNELYHRTEEHELIKITIL